MKTDKQLLDEVTKHADDAQKHADKAMWGVYLCVFGAVLQLIALLGHLAIEYGWL